MKKNIQLLTILFILLFQINQSFAARYYFSSTSGNDSRSASEAQNPATPWRSIDKLNAIFRNLKPGDEIFFKRGDVFYGTIKISRSGANGRPIKFDAYGAGPKPIITSLVTLNDWKNLGSGIYEAGHQLLRDRGDVVLVNRDMQEMGRYPNSDADNKGYLTYDGASWNSISDGSLSSSTNWSGGEVVIRKNFWAIDRHKIAWHSGKTISYTNFPVAQFSPSPGYGYFIQNHPNTLDKFGEWYFDSKSKKLRVHFGGSSPSSHRVEVATKDYLVTNSAIVRHITFSNLHFKGANKSAFHLGNNGSDVLFNNVEIEYSGINAVEIEGISNFRIEHSKIRHTNNNAIVLKSSKDASIKDNLIEDTYLFPGHGQNGNNNGVAIRTDSDGSHIEHNRILNTGYSGISFTGNDVLIKNNYINYFCLTTNDGGGIYTYSSAHRRNSNRKIIGNIVLNGIGVQEGAIKFTLLSKPQAEGIYIDDNASHVEVIGNTVAHMTSKGIYLHNANNVRVRDNVVYDNTHQIYLRNDHMGGQLQDNRIENNFFLSKDAFQSHIHIQTHYNDVPRLADFASNYYATPLIDEYRIETVQNTGSRNQVSLQFNLQSWQNTFGKDWGSKLFKKQQKTHTVRRMLGSERFKNGTFDSKLGDVGCNNCTVSLDRTGKLDGNALKVNTHGVSGTFLDIGAVQKGKRYVLKFTGRSSGKTIGLSSYLRHGKSPWENISETRNHELSGSRKDYEVVFQALDNDDNARLLLAVNQKENVEFYLDNIEFFEAEVDVVDSEEVILFEYNNSKNAKKVHLSGEYVDLKNNRYTSSVDLAPFSSILLVKVGNQVPKPAVPAATVTLVVPDNSGGYTAGADVNLRAEVVDEGNTVAGVDFYRGDQKIGSVNKSPYQFAWKNVTAGNHNLHAKARLKDASVVASSAVTIHVKVLAIRPDTEDKPDVSQPVDEQPVEIPSDDSFSPIFLNAGTTVDVDYQGNKFLGDEKFKSYHKSVSIYSNRNINVDELYQTERNGEQMEYEIPVPNGTYTVKTYHNELWFGKYGPASAAGQRVYDIIVEGKTLKEDFDIFKENNNRPTELSFTNVQVTDGVLNLDLVASVNRASISGIAIYKTSSEAPRLKETANAAIYLNAGSSEDVQYGGKAFKGENGKNKHYKTSTANINRFVSADALYQTERYGRNLKYSIPVDNGTYTVQTYHNELWFGSWGPSAQAGRRIFDISIEGSVRKKRFDLFVENRNRPTVLTFRDVQVKDGILNIDLSAERDNATISGIAIIPQGSGTSYANMRIAEESTQAAGAVDQEQSVASQGLEIKLYPNPASNVANLLVPMDIGEFEILVHHTNGQLMDHLEASRLVTDSGRYAIPVDHLQSGVYLVTLVTKREIIQRLRLIVSP